MHIKEVKAKVIKNSRKEPTIEVTINKKFTASAPSGASTGKHEVETFPKRGVKHVVDLINKHHNFKGAYIEEFEDLRLFEVSSSQLGGNGVIALQGAALKAMSNNRVYKFLSPKTKTLPIPLGNCIGGGVHTQKKSTDIQEYLLIPKAKTFKQRMGINNLLYNKIGKVLDTKYRTDEGAFISNMSTTKVFEFLNEIKDKNVSIGIDVAASEFYKNQKYSYKNYSKNKKRLSLTRKQQIGEVNHWIKEYKLSYVEDPLQEEDFKGFAQIDKSALVCGDDLVTTNLSRFKKAIKNKAVNSIIVKPNQIGSLLKTRDIVKEARKQGIKTVISHRSGETMDPLISHLAVGWKIPYIKTGIYGKERLAKLKELRRIEHEISS